ncbi:MAG: GNAT family N-acetyltransferase, partial [Sutterellaceae bacterium]|nr:GNAT family N-acetyltransferase [Sutterellaceae bacterium]
EAMIREAFWNCFAPGAMEHYLLHEMRGSADYIPELTCVAECDGKIVGMAAFAKAKLVTDDAREVEVLTLGPIGVLPEFQNQGVGKKL